MEGIKIKKAKIKNNLFLQYEYQQTVGNVTNGHNTSSDAPIHEDLRKAFRGLIPHFAFMCEEIPEKKMKQIMNGNVPDDDEFYSKFLVQSFSIGGSGDSEGVTLSGCKQVESGVVNFNSPFKKWDDDYKYMDALIDAVELAKSEVFEYMNGKQAPNAQQEMNFEDFDTEELFDDSDESVSEPDYQESIAAFKKATKGMKVSISTSSTLE